MGRELAALASLGNWLGMGKSQGPPQTNWTRICFWRSPEWFMCTLMSGKYHPHDPLSWLPLALNKQWPPSKLTLFALKTVLLCRVTFPALKWRVTLVCVCPTLQSSYAYSVSHGAATLRDLFFFFFPKLTIACCLPRISSKWTHLSCLANVCSWGRFIVSLRKQSAGLTWQCHLHFWGLGNR